MYTEACANRFRSYVLRWHRRQMKRRGQFKKKTMPHASTGENRESETIYSVPRRIRTACINLDSKGVVKQRREKRKHPARKLISTDIPK